MPRLLPFTLNMKHILCQLFVGSIVNYITTSCIHKRLYVKIFHLLGDLAYFCECRSRI